MRMGIYAHAQFHTKNVMDYKTEKPP